MAKSNKEEILQMRKDRIGEMVINKWGNKMTIISYLNTKNIIVQFDDGFQKKCNYGNFKKGIVNNPKQ